MNNLINNLIRSLRCRKALMALGAAAAASSMAIVSCHNAHASKDHPESAATDPRPDDELTALARAIADGDAPAFAARCIYPLQRPYPLRNIEDSVDMVDYFHVLVDDSFRDRMRRTRPDDWENYGWRGWSLCEDNAMWYDNGLWAFNYESAAESGLKRRLAREELMSLAPEFRDGWAPVMSLSRTDGPGVFRIDCRDDEYRLMHFDDPSNVAHQPKLLLSGTMRTEGSAQSRIFEFSNQEGIKAEYLPDAEPQLFIYITGTAAVDDSIAVSPAYWREIIKFR